MIKVFISFWAALVALAAAKDKDYETEHRLTWEYTEFDSEVNP